jgi:hypothetical protein
VAIRQISLSDPIDLFLSCESIARKIKIGLLAVGANMDLGFSLISTLGKGVTREDRSGGSSNVNRIRVASNPIPSTSSVADNQSQRVV